MRIGMLTDAYKPVTNGVTNSIALHKRQLEAAGHTVMVFTWGSPQPEDKAEHIIRSPALPISDTGYHISLRYSDVARQQLQTMDLLHVHHPFVSGRLALRYGKAWGLPIVYTNHTRYDLYAQHYLPPLSDALAEMLLRSYMPGFTAQCDLVVAPSPGLAAVLRDLGVTTPITIIPNGIDLASFRTPAQPRWRTDFGWPAEAHVLIYTGRLSPEKNLDLLLRAFAAAQTALPELRLLLVGDGPEAPRLRQQVAQMGLHPLVHFAGLRPYAEVPGYLAAADAFITASVTEVHPLSVVEALAAGLPVIGVNAPGVNDLIEHGYNGLLALEDAASLAAHIVRLMADESLRARLAAGARATSERYSIERTTAEYLRHYEALVALRTTDSQRSSAVHRPSSPTSP
jgi:1,2-diacylglycerol 3-alpha-glucosyltransferase